MILILEPFQLIDAGLAKIVIPLSFSSSQLTDAPIKITDSNKQYKKRIYKLKYKKHSLQSFAVEMEADGGIPIKRLVNGFSVIPNISSILNTDCFCEKFDVDQIYLSK